MAISKKTNKIARNLFQRMWKLSQSTLKAVVNWVLRALLKRGKRPRLAKAGFALPTTIMVLLVVTLLTTTLVLRSMDRNRNAINARSEQVIQNTSTPALDRAKAKLTELLADPELPRGAPPDKKLLEVMSADKYTFGDETRLKLVFDLDESGNIDNQTDTPNLDSRLDETLNAAWRYPVDTDGNGLYDAFTLYGMYWRNPAIDPSTQEYERPRGPIEARSVPQDTVGIGSQCRSAGLTAASSVEEGWFKQGSNLSKAFYTYVATVPISKEYFNSNIAGGNSGAPYTSDKFEPNLKGGKAFSGLEYQQDRYRSGLNNNSVWYENDLVLSPGDAFRLNGRVFTNGNLLIGSPAEIKFYQVSDPFSCFYEEANAKINVGGNVVFGDLNNSSGLDVNIHLFKGKETAPDETSAVINKDNQSSTTNSGSQVAYNDAAYIRRLTFMKQMALSFCAGCEAASANSLNEPSVTTVAGVAEYPKDLVDSFKERVDNKSGGENNYDILAEEIELYLRNRTRRFTYAEIPEADGSTALNSYNANNVFDSGTIEPIALWREPEDANTGLTLVPSQLAQTNPERQKKNKKEDFVGDRINVGNNLPALWKKDGKYVGEDTRQEYSTNTPWTAGGGTRRYRTTQIQAQQDVGASSRNGYWELAAATDPKAPDSPYAGGGGLRVITGAGIYVDGENISDGAAYPRNGFTTDKKSFLPPPSWDTKLVPDPTAIPRFRNLDNILVWPDLMPMTGGLDRPNEKGDLRMRATAVYHYVDYVADGPSPSEPPAQEPIACVSSYYDPTDKNTARNPVGLPDVSGISDNNGDGTLELFDGTPPGPQPAAPEARSNNGVVYPFPGRGGYNAKLLRQARLVFPDGRIANEPLRKALSKVPANYNIVDYSAIDTAICAIAILEGAVNPDDSQIPYGAIKESSFLDAREVKAIDKRLPNDINYDINANYDLPLEQRQPLEIRVTDIDLGLLATKTHGSNDANNDNQVEDEYLLPNSGIIYASRDDALPDRSDTSDQAEALSPNDFRLDLTRRPNGIRLINGLRLARGAGNDYLTRKEEKGLILATNLPAYVKGNFNLHLLSGTTGTTELEEFQEALETDAQAVWNNFYTRNDNPLESRFACRANQPLCDSPGDQWRPATIIADAITLQSEKYKEGYRNQGDFDLRNNGGGVLAGNQVGNGFFDNSFVTSAPWFDPTTNLPKNSQTDPEQNTLVSYLVNGVTPIQRRADGIRAYATERCTKIPVSACTAADWQPDNSDTANSPPIAGAEQRYARRVSFQRNGAKYFYDTNGDPLPTATRPDASNALWFRTRDKTDPTNPPNPKYDGVNGPGNNAPDYATVNDRLFIFQPPEVPDLGLLRGYVAASTNQFAVLDPTDPAKPVIKDDLKPTIPAAVTTYTAQDVTDKVAAIYQSITAPDTSTPLGQAVANFNQYSPALLTLDISQLPPDKKTEITGGGVMAVYQAGSMFMNSNRALTLKGDAGSVFVFIVSGNLSVNAQGALQLDGVVPENVYWIVNGTVTVGGQTTLYGNVLTPSQITLRAKATLEGRAFSTLASGVDLKKPGNQAVNFAQILAPNGNHPRLVPVTQIQSPDGTPDVALNIGQSNTYRNAWLQQPISTKYNAAFVVGDSPNRPVERSAGLHNLVRVQENWSPEGQGAVKHTVTIKGSFIEIQRSAYATGPFATIRKTGSTPTETSDDGTLSLFGYPDTRYQTTVGNGTQPYYSPPTRQWGFDVGLLSQTPDLFSQRFTSDISKTQNYYRQVGRDDPWVKTLLCAAEPANPTDPAERNGTKSGTQYNRYAVPDSERPKCDDWVGADIGDYPANPS